MEEEFGAHCLLFILLSPKKSSRHPFISAFFVLRMMMIVIEAILRSWSSFHEQQLVQYSGGLKCFDENENIFAKVSSRARTVGISFLAMCK